MSDLRKNLGYQTLYQILLTVMPLITAPYLARTLGVEMQGVYSYTSSVVNYFILFGMIGITNHGIRTIAESRNNKYLKISNFKTIYCIQIFTNLIALGLYSLYLLRIKNDTNINIYYLHTILIIASIFDINWFFFGIEEFKVTIRRNVIIKILTVIMILYFVNKPEDLWIYTTLMSLSILVSNLVLWFYIPKYLNIKDGEISNIKGNIKSSIILFIPLLAMSVYHLMDKTMLGLLSDFSDVGYYYNADKIINIPIGILVGISNVFFPRMSSLLKEKDYDTYKKTLLSNIEIMGVVSIIIGLGIATISKEFVILFLGESFEYTAKLIIVLSPIVLLKGISLCIRYQFLIPNKLEKQFILSTVLGAILNFLINIILIPKFGALGAVIGTLIAELSSCAYQVFSTRKFINLDKVLFNLFIYLCIGVFMFLVVRIISSNMTVNLVFKIIIEILIGALIFYLLSLFFIKIRKEDTNLYKFIYKNDN